jgi:hypothetical protein
MDAEAGGVACKRDSFFGRYVRCSSPMSSWPLSLSLGRTGKREGCSFPSQPFKKDAERRPGEKAMLAHSLMPLVKKLLAADVAWGKS